MEQDNKILTFGKILVRLLEMIESLSGADNEKTVNALTDACYATARAIESSFVKFSHDEKKGTTCMSINPFL